MEQCSSREATSASRAVSKIFETWRFLTTYTTARHLSLSRFSCILSTPSYPIYWRYVLILTSQLRLCLSSGFIPSGFLNKILYAFISPPTHTCHLHRPLRLPCPDQPNDILWEVKVMQLPPFSSQGPNALRASYSRTPSVSETTHIIGFSTTESCRDVSLVFPSMRFSVRK
jgi:hypothetical protein